MADKVSGKTQHIKPICPHGRQKTFCSKCDSGSIWQHVRVKNRCKACGGVSICEHGRRNEFNARIAEVPVSANMKDRSLNVPMEMVRLYAEAPGSPYNSGCRTCGNSAYDRFCTIALLIYFQMILQHRP